MFVLWYSVLHILEDFPNISISWRISLLQVHTPCKAIFNMSFKDSSHLWAAISWWRKMLLLYQIFKILSFVSDIKPKGPNTKKGCTINKTTPCRHREEWRYQYSLEMVNPVWQVAKNRIACPYLDPWWWATMVVTHCYTPNLEFGGII